MALFISLIIRLFQLVFLTGIVFFSHNKLVNSVFQPAYQHSAELLTALSLHLASNEAWALFRCTPKVRIFSLSLHHINLWTPA
jgi:hypothetical protein